MQGEQTKRCHTPGLITFLLASLYKGSTALFDSAGSGSIPLGATVDVAHLVSVPDCESGEGGSSPLVHQIADMDGIGRHVSFRN